jgi:N,N-dimethylformamidase beta subunit-like protein
VPATRGFSTTRWRFLLVVIAVCVVLIAGVGAWIVAANDDGSSSTPRSETIVAENRRRGSSDWRIATGAYRGIDGYANRVSARVGDTITLYVSTPAPSFRVDAYRMGWYRGLGGRLVWRSEATPGARQRRARIVQPTRTVTTDWSPTMRVRITDDWLPGDYLLKLVSSRGGQSWVPLTVRDDANHAVLVVNSVATWQAYNDWGGYSLYFGPNSNPKERSQIVSYDRPYNWAVAPNAGDAYDVCCGFVITELGIVAFIERLGLDVGYTTDVDVHQHPGSVLHHRVVVSPGHDEYWSVEMRDAVVAARGRGVNLVFAGPNAVYWRIRLEPSALGPDRLQVNYRVARDDPHYARGARDVTTTWRSPPHAQPESSLTGVMYFCLGGNEDGVVADASSWVFDGTGLRNGDHVPDLIQREADHVDTRFPTPDNVQILFHSPATCAGLGGKPLRGLFSDTTYYTASSGAGVFTTGAPWVCRLYDACPEGQPGPNRSVQRVLENVLRVFAAGPAGEDHPSKGNVDAVLTP